MSKKKVLLVSANSETVPAPVYPLALARLAGAIEQAGHHARQFDLLTHGLDALPQFIEEMQPDLVALSLRNIDNTDSGDPKSYVGDYHKLVEQVRRSTGVPIVIGGSAFSLFPEELMLRTGAQFGVVGPGEQALCFTIDALDEASNLSEIPRIMGSGFYTSFSAKGSPACAEPLHDRKIVSYYWREGGMIGIQTKRGCPKRCSYCTYPLIDGREVECYNVGEVVDEIEWLSEEIGVSYFFIVDSVFNLDREKEIALAKEICRRSLTISWGAFFSPSGINREYLEKLKRSGLTHVEFGTESLSDRMLDSYAKDFSVDDVLEASSACEEAEIYTAHYLLFGGPGETVETVTETMKNARALKKCVFFPFAGVRIYPKTELFSVAKRETVVDTEEECLNPVFYFSPGIDVPGIWEIVVNHVGEARNWFLPSKYQLLAPFMQKMRQRGMKGPLWEYLIE